jgi:hypothetical protein
MFALYVLLAVVLSLAALLGAWMHRNRRLHRQFVEAVNDALQRSFGDLLLPKLTVGFSYSFPSFQLEFESREQHQAAADSGAVSRFMTEVQRLCRDRGTKDNPFDVRKALYCTDPEQQRALSKWGAEERQKFEERDGKK